MVKNSSASAGDWSLISGLGRSHGEGNGSPLQYSRLGNLIEEEPDRLQAIGSQKSQT